MKIKDRDCARQIVDFSGLRRGNIWPTDIDGCIDYRNKALVLLEFKYNDARMKDGQRWALEHIADDVQKAGKDCAVMLCTHFVKDCGTDVDASRAVVRAVYWHGKWTEIRDGRTLGEQIGKYLRWVDRNPLM